ncbi:hypothetical protein [Pyxidicoccus xibeiensis]|uniref:hypothetical protein n=1 Tax=Pyxidicoccus xibeiensis TaxID=2906759 RepID=UPI0020A7B0A4|nr:hypothetical protein [Pyxidicoccus xibeiensis]MCP3136187.1 hypothetical protein [Pyxidicoccus xibeiensis]
MRRNWMKWGLTTALALGLVGCGGEDSWVYDVELDAAALADVPTTCTGEAVAPAPGPANIPAQQRWHIWKAEFESTRMEVPDVDYVLPGVSISIDDDAAPDVIEGTALESGPYQFVGAIRTDVVADGAGTRKVLQFVIQNESLEDAIQGYVWVRREVLVSDAGVVSSVGECISKVPLTGRRVRE